MQKPPSALVRQADRPVEGEFRHPLNPSSEIHGFQLGRLAGLQRMGVNWIRIPPGRESYVYHTHRTEEEWVYILSGRGVAEIEGKEYEVGPGDFMGFPTPSVAHHLRNPFDADLVYLCGGEAREVEVCDYPHLKLRLNRFPDRAEVISFDDIRRVL